MVMAELPYGETTLRFKPPEAITASIYKPKTLQGLRDPYKAILDSIKNPMVGEKLAVKAEDAEKPLIIISDSTRPTPSRLIVKASLHELNVAGIPDENVTVLIATGLHRPCTDLELIETLGKDLMNRVNVINHDAQDKSSIEYICDTSLGTPFHVNKLVTESDLLIGDGYIEPHFFAGYTGGGKNILPGVSGKETILCNHGVEMIDHPNARAGTLHGNPIYMDIVDGAELVQYGFSVNVTLNNRKQVSGVFTGDFKEAHLKGTQFLDPIVKVPCPEADISIVTNGGYPLDRDLYQAVKAMSVGEASTQEGGVIIVVSQCRDGVGHPQFRKLVEESDGPSELLEKIRTSESFFIDQWQAQIMARILLRNKVICVTDGVDEATLRSMHLEGANNVDEAVRKAIDISGRDPVVNIHPSGPSTIPVRK